jgi:uncharacterized protein YaiI (UPF0178 family)
MRIWVDADAIPGAVRTLIERTADKRRIETVFVADKYVRIPHSPWLRCETVVQGPDAADDLIAERAEPGDICVTQDIPLAARLVKKGVCAIDPRGSVHTEASVGERLSIRNFMEDLRGAGVVTGGPAPFGPRDVQRFADAFDREITRRRRG